MTDSPAKRRPLSAPGLGRREACDQYVFPEYNSKIFRKRLRKDISGVIIVNKEEEPVTPSKMLCDGIRTLKISLESRIPVQNKLQGDKTTARSILITGLLQAEALYTRSHHIKRPKSLRATDAYKLLSVTAIRCSKHCLEESDRARRSSLRIRFENKIMANALLEESNLKGSLAGELMKFLSESRKYEHNNIRKSHNFLRKKLSEVLEDWIEE